MEIRKPFSLEDGADAVWAIMAELDATHDQPFASCFLVEHWPAIERALVRIISGWGSNPRQ